MSGRNLGSALLSLSLVALSLSLSGPLLEAQVFSGKLTASDGQPDDEFGISVAVSGNVCAVGAQYRDYAGFNSGVVYVYRHSQGAWQEEQIVSPQDASERDWFGWSLALDGDLLVVGAYGDDDLGQNSGAAYVFRHDGAQWNQEAKLLASDGAMDDRFGVAVAVSRDLAVVGANLHAGAGAAYVFRHGAAGWEEEKKLTASDGAPLHHFGARLALDSERVVIGAPQLVVPGGAGAAYIYERNGGSWPEMAKLIPSDGEEGDWFGLSLALEGDLVIVGAPGVGDAGDLSGAAYVFREIGASAWEEEAKLTAPDASYLAQFGASVGTEADLLVVGAPRSFEDGLRSGAVYEFLPGSGEWLPGEKIVAPDAEGEDRFGSALAVGPAFLVIGAPRDDDLGPDSGSATTYQMDPNLDTTPPTVAFSSPLPGSTAGGVLPVEVEASDDTGVAGVSLFVNGDLVSTESEAPYEWSLDSGGLEDGPHFLRAEAADLSGNSAAAEITVFVDNTPPSVSIESPAPGSTLSGTVEIVVAAADPSGLARVDIVVDEEVLASLTAPPFVAALDTTGLPDGAHTLEARAFDSLGHEGSSGAIPVEVANGSGGELTFDGSLTRRHPQRTFEMAVENAGTLELTVIFNGGGPTNTIACEILGPGGEILATVSGGSPLQLSATLTAPGTCAVRLIREYKNANFDGTLALP